MPFRQPPQKTITEATPPIPPLLRSEILGVLVAANVLNSERAAEASVQVVRAFVKLRQMLASNAELARKLDELERKYDHQFKIVFDAIRQLMTPPPANAKPIGFRVSARKK